MTTEHQQVYKVLLTGGPCGGKTTSIPIVKQHLEKFGIKVLTAPEVATIIYSNGAQWSALGADTQCESVKVSIKLQEAMEDSFFKFASFVPNKPAVVLVDRGLLDNETFMSKEHWEMIMNDCGYTNVGIKARYDQVIHMMSVACDKPEVYTKANNTVRRESAEEAALKDAKTQQSYIGHPRFFIINNSTDLEGKAARVANTILDMLGVKAKQVIPESLSERLVLTYRYRIDYKEKKQHQEYMQALKSGYLQEPKQFTNNNAWFHALQGVFTPKTKYVDIHSERTLLSPQLLQIAAEGETLEGKMEGKSTSKKQVESPVDDCDEDEQDAPFIEKFGSAAEGAYVYYYKPIGSSKKYQIPAQEFLSLCKESKSAPVVITQRARFFVFDGVQFELVDFNNGACQILKARVDTANVKTSVPSLLLSEAVTFSPMSKLEWEKQRSVFARE